MRKEFLSVARFPFSILLPLVAVLASCEPGENPAPQKSKLTGWTEFYKTEWFIDTPARMPLKLDTLFKIAEYNAKGHISGWKERSGIAVSLNYDGNTFVGWINGSLHYNLKYEQGLPVRIEMSTGGGPISYDSLAYDDRGRLTYYHRQVLPSRTAPGVVNAYKLIWTNDDVSAVDYVYGDHTQVDPVTGKYILRMSNRTRYTYENLPNVKLPMQVDGPGAALVDVFTQWHLLSKQRAVRSEVQLDERSFSSRDFRYTTDADNRLLESEEVIQQLVDGEKAMKRQIKTVYTYK